MSQGGGDCDLKCQQAAIILNGEQVIADAETVCEIMTGPNGDKFTVAEAAHISDRMRDAHGIFKEIESFIAAKIGPFNRG